MAATCKMLAGDDDEEARSDVGCLTVVDTGLILF